MNNQEIAKLLRNVAVAYTIKDEKKYRFQIMAYNNAADSIESMTSQIKNLTDEHALDEIPGVGASIRAHLHELITTGKVQQFEAVLSELPQAMFPLLDIPSFGPKKAYKLVTHFKLVDPETVVADIEKLARDGKIAELEGFGAKSQDLILKAIEEFFLGKDKHGRMSFPFANELAEKIITYMKKCPEVSAIYPLGSLRRKRDTIGDIDIAVTTTNNEAVLDHFVAYPYIERLLQRGKNEANFLTAGGKRVDLRTQAKESFGSLLQHFTGSKSHNVHLRAYALEKGISLSEWGIKSVKQDKITTYDTEEAFYAAIGLQWIPPEMREDMGEIELAAEKKLPSLIELSDIRGDFHLHSSYPIEPSHDMGRNTMADMIEKAQSLGYTYLGFSEHNPSLSRHNSKEIKAIIEKRSTYIEQLKSKYNVRIFSLIETDISPNGSIALDDDSLQLLDGILVSIHSSFGMDRSEMTQRILKGLSHPKVKIFAHPTARLINNRPSIDADWEKIFDYCAANSKALEINASPQRLDLPDELVRVARKKGCKFFIDTDSHATEHMDLMQYGVTVARRGWATKSDILNSWETKKLEEWFKK